MNKTAKKALIFGALSGALLYFAKKIKDENRDTIDIKNDTKDGFIKVPQNQE